MLYNFTFLLSSLFFFFLKIWSEIGIRIIHGPALYMGKYGTFFTTLFVQLIHFKNIRPNFYNLCSLISLPLVCENLKSYQSSPWLDQYIINTMLLNKYDNLPVR